MGRKLFSSFAFLFCSHYNLQRRHRTVLANGHRLECDTFFRMHWNCGRIILQSPNGRFLGIAPNSLLIANATSPGELSSPPASLFQVWMLSRELEHIGMSTGIGGQKIWVCILAESLTFCHHLGKPPLWAIFLSGGDIQSARLIGLAWGLETVTHLKGKKNIKISKCFHKHFTLAPGTQ